MHNIQLKNKRGKGIAVLQWERPEDLVNWASGVANQNGLEFRNVEAEMPVMLKGEEAPVHKLKVVTAGVKNTYRSFPDIKTSLMSVLDNLQEEFEALMCKGFVSEKLLNDKKNQIDVLNGVLSGVELQEKVSAINLGALQSHLQSRGKRIHWNQLNTNIPGPLLQAKKEIDDFFKRLP